MIGSWKKLDPQEKLLIREDNDVAVRQITGQVHRLIGTNGWSENSIPWNHRQLLTIYDRIRSQTNFESNLDRETETGRSIHMMRDCRKTKVPNVCIQLIQRLILNSLWNCKLSVFCTFSSCEVLCNIITLFFHSTTFCNASFIETKIKIICFFRFTLDKNYIIIKKEKSLYITYCCIIYSLDSAILRKIFSIQAK